MSRNIKIRVVLAVMAVFFLGFLISWLLNPLLRELGHLSLAYAFNREAIAKFSYSPLDAIKELFGLLRDGHPHYVEYTGSIYEVFTPLQTFFRLDGWIDISARTLVADHVRPA